MKRKGGIPGLLREERRSDRIAGAASSSLAPRRARRSRVRLGGSSMCGGRLGGGEEGEVRVRVLRMRWLAREMEERRAEVRVGRW